jgi:transposase-like protein
MEVPENVDGENIQTAFEFHIAPKQSIKSDGHRACNVIKEMGHRHQAEALYSRQGPPNYDALKWVNILASNAKAFILSTYHGVMKKHLQRYLSEFCYRFNRRLWSGQGFDRLLLTCANTNTVPYAELRR